MVYACRICSYDEIGENQCVYRNDLLTVTKWVLCSYVRLGVFDDSRLFREQVGVTHDLPSDTTLVCFHILERRLIISSLSGACEDGMSGMWSRRVRPPLARRQLRCWPSTRYFSSAVYFQDQSKRRETRMIQFYVCTKCNHNYLDPTLPQDSRPDEW